MPKKKWHPWFVNVRCCEWDVTNVAAQLNEAGIKPGEVISLYLREEGIWMRVGFLTYGEKPLKTIPQ
jgi:hypothetical protein